MMLIIANTWFAQTRAGCRSVTHARNRVLARRCVAAHLEIDRESANPASSPVSLATSPRARCTASHPSQHTDAYFAWSHTMFDAGEVKFVIDVELCRAKLHAASSSCRSQRRRVDWGIECGSSGY